jgi:hypothetical protein
MTWPNAPGKSASAANKQMPPASRRDRHDLLGHRSFGCFRTTASTALRYASPSALVGVRYPPSPSSLAGAGRPLRWRRSRCPLATLLIPPAQTGIDEAACCLQLNHSAPRL